MILHRTSKLVRAPPKNWIRIFCTPQHALAGLIQTIQLLVVVQPAGLASWRYLPAFPPRTSSKNRQYLFDLEPVGYTAPPCLHTITANCRIFFGT